MSGSVPFGFLVLAKQPFPKPVKKNIKVCGSDGAHEEPTLVRLLSFRYPFVPLFYYFSFFLFISFSLFLKSPLTPPSTY